jgi:acyl-CoA synthetase (AMP-forming)/AMP-acid ligase II
MVGALHAAGLQPGDRVSVQTEKSPELLILYQACLAGGFVFHPINTAYREGDLSQSVRRRRAGPCGDGVRSRRAGGRARARGRRADPEDQPLGDDAVGEIQVKGPNVCRGYWRNPEKTAEAFTADGWFRTGDLGRWQDGRLEVLGRADDVIITGGVNVAPMPVERILAEQSGVREACVIGVADAEWGQAVVAAVVPDDPAAPPAADALRAAVRELTSAAATPKRIVYLDELPLRGPGKPDRRALAVLLAQSQGDNPRARR